MRETIESKPADASTRPILHIVQQHAEESAFLRQIRSRLVVAPHIKLKHLRRYDDRLEAHLDGLVVAGEFGTRLCEEAMESPGVGEIFALAVRALETKDRARLDRLFSLVEATPKLTRGLISAFGWVAADYLKGTVKSLLDSREPLRRTVGLAACAMHQVDPGPSLVEALVDADASVRARGLRMAGERGRGDLLAHCRNALRDDDEVCRFWAAHSALLLGDRGAALGALAELGLRQGPFRLSAMQLSFRAMDIKNAHEHLQRIAKKPEDVRLLIQGSGIVGDPGYVPWLIKHMENPKLARLAGQSFTFITGLDLSYLDLDDDAPESFESGPNDNPEDENVELDADDDLPWPHSGKIAQWWEANQHGFRSGVNYFMGEPVTVEQCKRVLRDGYQPQRWAATLWLSLQQPATQPLFPVRAPARCQEKLLALDEWKPRTA